MHIEYPNFIDIRLSLGLQVRSDKLAIREARPSSVPSLLLQAGTVRLKENMLADAILDRIAHSLYTITIEGIDSMRKHKGLIN